MMSEYWKEQMAHEPTKNYYETLLRTVRRVRGKTNEFIALEIGTGWGISGSALLDANISDLITIDCNQTAEYCIKARQEIESRLQKGQTVRFINERIESIREIMLEEYGGKCKVVYIDGSHDYVPCRDDLFMAWELCGKKGCIILDDFLHAKNLDGGGYGIFRAVRELQLKKQVEVTIIPTSVNGLCLIKKK